MPNCSVVGCDYRKWPKDGTYQSFPIPIEPYLRKKWLTILNRDKTFMTYVLLFFILRLRLWPTAKGQSFSGPNIRLRPKVTIAPTVQHYCSRHFVRLLSLMNLSFSSDALNYVKLPENYQIE